MAAEVSHRSGSLPQQGSIDWVALSKTTVSFSVELLARYARAGVETLTIAVGQALFAQFDVPADAQRRLELSVSRLKAFSSAANALWFGIGFKHLIRTLSETEQGATLVAVSSCLMVSYDQQFSATVLKALCDKTSLPEKLTPSLSQWGSFVKLCTAAVTASHFPILVEGFSRLLVSNAAKREQRGLAATSPGELAGALCELAQLSTKKVANVTLMGNADCGWLAALAEWLFSLRIEIVDQTGNVLYQSKGVTYPSTAGFQLTIIRLEDGQTSVPQSLLRSRTYLVPPGDLCFNLRTETSYNLFYNGRSEWSTILNDTFGDSFHRLLEPEIIPLFAQVLYSGIYADQNHSAVQRMNPWGDSLLTTDSMQHQQNFRKMLCFAAARLPELSVLEKYGRDHASELNVLDLDRHKIPPGDEIREFERQFGRPKKGIKDDLIVAGFSTALIFACSCGDCNVVNDNPASQVDHIPIPGHLCLAKIAIAIFDFIWRLSWLDMDDTIRPSSTGLMSLYSRHPERVHTIRTKHLRMSDFGPIIMLLTGFEAQLFRDSSAVSVHGLCVYRPSLEDPSLGVERQVRLRVVPGQIERHDKIYDQIEEKMNPWLTHRDKCDTDETTRVVAMLGADPLLQIAVEETLNATSLSSKLVVCPEKNTEIHWNYLYRPFLDREVQIQPQKSAFVSAPGELFAWIKNSLMHIQCRKTHRSCETHPLWTTHGAIKPWSGHCSIVDLPWWTHDPGVNGRLLSMTRPTEWVVAIHDTSMPNTLKIFCGSFALLYCILARSGTIEEHPFLIQSGDCLICMGLKRKPPFSPQEFLIQSPNAGQLQKLEFRVCADRVFINSELPT